MVGFAHRYILLVAGTIAFISLGATALAVPDAGPPVYSPQGLHESFDARAREALMEGLGADSFWVQVHAAEFLLALGSPDGVAAVFAQQRIAREEQRPERIGVWRVSYRLAGDEQARSKWEQLVLRAALDRTGPDRVHAIETAAKLGLRVSPSNVQEILGSLDEDAAPYGIWVALNQSDTDADHLQKQLASLLKSELPLARLRAAYVLASIDSNVGSVSDELNSASIVASQDDAATEIAATANAYILTAAWEIAVRSGEREKAAQFRKRLESLVLGSAAAGCAFANSLAKLGAPADGELLADYLESDNLDLRCSAAHALLEINRHFNDGTSATSVTQ